MDTQQMLELLLAKIDANQEKAEAYQEKAEADRKAAHEDLMAKTDAYRVQIQEFMKTLQVYQAKTDAILPAIQVTAATFEPEDEVETMACQGMEARQIEKSRPHRTGNQRW
jgi:hypothetical protein